MSGVVTFPMSAATRFRQELSRCRTERMLDAWGDRLDRAMQKKTISHDEYVELLDRSVRIGVDVGATWAARVG